MIVDDFFNSESYAYDQLVPELKLNTLLQFPLEEDVPLHTPVLDLDKTHLDDIFSDIESVVFPSLGDMNTSFMGGNTAPESTGTTSTTSPTASELSTAASTTNIVVTSNLPAQHGDEDIPFYDEMAPIKQEIDLGYEKASSPPESVSSSSEEEGDAEGQDCDMDHARKEVNDACNALEIPHNPALWSIEHTQRWAKWTLDQYNLPSAYVSEFGFSGEQLCKLTAQDFHNVSPKVGEYLFAQLEFWKSVYSFTTAGCESTPCVPDPVTCAQDVMMTPVQQQPSASMTSLSSSPPMTLTYTNLDQHMASAAATGAATAGSSGVIITTTPKCEPIVIAPIPTMAAPTSTYQIAQAGTSQYHGTFTTIKQEPVHGDLSSSLPNLAAPTTVGTVTMISASTPARSSPSLPQQQPTASTSGAGPSTSRGGPLPKLTQTKHNIHLWQFLRELLLHPESYSNCIRWLDRSKGIFKIEDSVRVARLWGQRKNRPAMNYDKLSRSIRQYYKKGIIKKTDNSKRLVYQFCQPYRV